LKLRIKELESQLREKTSSCDRMRNDLKHTEKRLDVISKALNKVENHDALKGAAHAIVPSESTKLPKLVLPCIECFAKNITCDSNSRCQNCKSPRVFKAPAANFTCQASIMERSASDGSALRCTSYVAAARNFRACCTMISTDGSCLGMNSHNGDLSLLSLAMTTVSDSPSARIGHYLRGSFEFAGWGRCSIGGLRHYSVEIHSSSL
jgi:hypothetical protein